MLVFGPRKALVTRRAGGVSFNLMLQEVDQETEEEYVMRMSALLAFCVDSGSAAERSFQKH